MNRSVCCTVLCLAWGVSLMTLRLAQALPYTQQLVLLEQANRAFEEAPHES